MKHIYRNVIICLLIGASFIGCNKAVDVKNPNVSIVSEEGFTTGEKHLFTGTTVKYGFNATSNAQTTEKLVKFQVFVAQAGGEWIYDTTYVLNNEDNFYTEGEFTFERLGDWRIGGRAFDAANNWTTAYIDIHVQEDMEQTLVWQQIALDSVTGFGNYGLTWVDRKVVDSVSVALDTILLMPADSLVSLYLFDESKWEEIDTYDGKDDFFKDIKKNPKNYKDNKIDSFGIFATEETVTYNAVIAVMNENEDSEHCMLFIKDSYSENYNESIEVRHLTVNGILK